MLIVLSLEKFKIKSNESNPIKLLFIHSISEIAKIWKSKFPAITSSFQKRGSKNSAQKFQLKSSYKNLYDTFKTTQSVSAQI